MTSNIKEVAPVTEEAKYKGVKHVNVDKTVDLIKDELKSNDQVELVSRQS